MEPKEIRFSDEAAFMWRAVYKELSKGKPGMLGSLIARSEPQVLRLSLVYALLDCSPLIQKEHLFAALAVWTYFENSARFIFGEQKPNPIADKILEALGLVPQGLTRTEISSLFGRNKSKEELEEALTALVARGEVRSVKEESTGRKPIERWLLV
jgi:hypothetical protein